MNNDIMIIIVKIIVMTNAMLMGWTIKIKEKKINIYKNIENFTEEELENFDLSTFVDDLLKQSNNV